MSVLGRVTLLAAAGFAARRLLQAGEVSFDGKVVLVTGGSRGLGLALAHEFAERGARLALLARNPEDVERAARELRDAGHEATDYVCDVRDRQQVDAAVNATMERFGRLDVVVNNAGTIQVGPLEAQTRQDFTDALDTMFWGVYHPTMAALDHLEAGGRIAVISSIGGKIAVPHLLPYSVAKFAAVGFAEGLRGELAERGILVTTVVPSLMRTGSHVNAIMKGDHSAEYTWFSAGASLPGLSVPADRAARRIVSGIARGDAEVMVGGPTQLATRAHGLAPATTVRVLSTVSRLLPSSDSDGEAEEPRLGRETGGGVDAATALGDRAAQEYRQE